MHLIPGPAVTRLSRSIVAWLAMSLLLVPLPVLNKLQSIGLRFVVIVIAMGAFIIACALLGKLKTPELLMASACYMAVMVVFISSST